MVAVPVQKDHSPVSTTLDLLDQVADKAYAALGSCNGRLARAVAIVRSGAATLQPSGEVLVHSQSQEDQTYTVNGSCPCPDAQHRAPNGHCKHLLAAWLVRRMHHTPTPTHYTEVDRTPALPEAPASVNCHITIEGRQVQVTLRDTDEARLLGRLAALLWQYPQAETHQATSQHNASQPDWCAKHGVPMKLNHGKNGSTWYSHRTAEDWCKGK